jgi:uncharacterized delta-60 repeat protein
MSKKIHVLMMAIAACCSTQAVAQAGAYDLSFGGTGMVSQGREGHFLTGSANERQPDGKIVSAGYFSKDEKNGIALTRHNADGSPDATFGTGGVVVTPKFLRISGVDYYNNMVSDMALQADGKIVVAGGTFSASGYMNYMLCRYKANGTLDSSFGLNGFTADIGELDGIHCQAYSIAIQADGKILAAGNAGYRGCGILRYKTNGTPDSSFGTNGVQTILVGHYRSEATDVALQPDGKIVFSGSAATIGATQIVVARLLADGSPDDAFGTHGMVMTPIGTQDARGLALVVAPSGRIMVAGSSDNELYTDFALAIYNPDGSLLKAVAADINTYSDYASSIALQKDGRIVLGGHIALARFDPDGSLDKTFGSGGKLVTPMATDNFDLTGLLIQPDDKILITGTTQEKDTTRFALVRVLQGPELGITDNELSMASLSVYPNPVAETATIGYVLGSQTTVSLSLLDLQGRVIRNLFAAEKQAAGMHQVRLVLPGELPAGTYTLRLSTPEGSTALAIQK